MPAVPVLGGGARREGAVEVLGELQPQHTGEADGDVDASRKIPVDDGGVEDDEEQDVHPAEVLGSPHDGLDRPHEGVRHHQLLEEAPKDSQKSRREVIPCGAVGGIELGRQIVIAADRPLHDRGEEGDEQGVLAEIGRRLGLASVDVDKVGRGAEGVEGDAQGQDEGRDRQGACGEQPQDIVDNGHGKTRVFQHREDAEIEDQPRHQNAEALLLPRRLVGLAGILVHVGLVGGYVVLVGLGAALDHSRQEEGGEDGHQDEGQIPPSRRGVEEDACGEQYHPLTSLGHEVVEQYRDRREEQEGE